MASTAQLLSNPAQYRKLYKGTQWLDDWYRRGIAQAETDKANGTYTVIGDLPHWLFPEAKQAFMDGYNGKEV
jgi:hypothetical protein